MQKIAARYAKALFRLAKDQKEKDLFFKHLSFFKDWMIGSSNFTDLFTNPLIPHQQASSVLKDICEKSKIDPTVSNFIQYIIDQNRLAAFPSIVDAFITLYQSDNNIKTGDIQTAYPLTKELEASFLKTLEAHFKTNLILKYRVDKDLLGGFRAQVGSYQLDASLQTQLTHLNRTLKGAS